MDEQTLDLASNMPSTTALAFLLFLLAVAIVNVTELLKMFSKAFTPPGWPTEPHPWWWQAMWRVIALAVGISLGWCAEQSSFFSFPWGAGCGLVAATFTAVLYNKGKALLEGLRLKALDSSAND